MTETLLNCPLCHSSRLAEYLTVKDHFLTGEIFHIAACQQCGFRFTNPRPTPEEIGRYYQSDEYISHDAEKNDLVSRIYRIARKFAIRSKVNLVKRHAANKSILDYGCGTGEFLAGCREAGFTVTGIEPSEKARNHAATRNQIPVFESLDALPSPDKGYSVITLWHVLEHVHTLNDTLAKLKSLPGEQRTLIVAVPDSSSPDAEKYSDHWAAYDVPRHLYHFTADSMRRLATRHQLRIIDIRPQLLDAFYVSLLSEKYRHGKNNLAGAFFSGLKSNFKAKSGRRGYSSMIFILQPEKQ